MKNRKRSMWKISAGLLALATVLVGVGVGSLVAGATVPDITVTIDTGAEVTLKDNDGDSYYDIGTADELYAFAAITNNSNAISAELTKNIVVNKDLMSKLIIAEDGSATASPTA